MSSVQAGRLFATVGTLNPTFLSPRAFFFSVALLGGCAIHSPGVAEDPKIRLDTRTEQKTDTN